MANPGDKNKKKKNPYYRDGAYWPNKGAYLDAKKGVKRDGASGKPVKPVSKQPKQQKKK